MVWPTADSSPPSGAGGPLDGVRADPRLGPQLIATRVVPARAGTYAPIPTALDPTVTAMLHGRGLEALYSHQATAVRAALDGHHVAVVTPTASGKTLCYQLPVLDALVRRPGSRALYLFPTKALAHDQLERLARDLGDTGLDPALALAYDGDTPAARRTAARARARVLVTNPDMLHVGILPDHVRWRGFLAGLEYVVVDEMHTYRGIFGSHVAHVLGRLRRLCRLYGSDPRFVCASATIANPGELAEALIGEPAVVVAENGAPEPSRSFGLYNPPVVDRQLGIRRSAAEDARMLAMHFLRSGQQTVVFTRSRLGVETLVIALRRDAPALGLGPEAVRGYRAGYLGDERRTIEAGLRDGSVRCVVATSALELGIDIGGLAACVLVGYPGSSASLWQRAGRVGRGLVPGVAVMVASDSPLDQYLVAHADQLLVAAPEAARVNRHNLYVQMAQTRASLYELPMDAGDVAGDGAAGSVLAALEQAGDVRQAGGRWFWASAEFPAADISLRSAGAERISIFAGGRGDEPRLIGQVEADAAPRWVHPQAIYLHEGAQYLVHTLDLEAGIAQAEAVRLPYLTVAAERTEVEIERTGGTAARGELVTSFGEIRLTSRVTSFRREEIDSHRILSREALDLPDQVTYTTACWLGIDPALVERLDGQGLWSADRGAGRGPDWLQQRALARARDAYRCRHCGAEELPGQGHDVHHIEPFDGFGWIPGQNRAYLEANRLDNLITLCPRCHRLAERQAGVSGTLSDLGYLLRYLVPLWIMCDPADIGIHCDSAGQQAGIPALFVYDRAPGGSGISDALPAIVMPLLESARDRLDACPCDSGCPSCIGPSLTPRPVRKVAVRALLSGLVQR